MQPEQLGPYRIGRVLGRGGMGVVYEGTHEQTGERSAVKVLLSTLEEDEDVRLRFEAEIDTLKRLRHPNIVRLNGFGTDQGFLYYVMEMVDGASLHQELKRQRLFEWQEVAKIGLEMCSAIKHAHDRGIIHRDIKPANILLHEQGGVKLSDFGIAHFFGGQRITEAHSVVGTLEYMSPEQTLAQPVGPKSDLYSLGAVLYALLVRKPPFVARNLSEIIRKHQNSLPESIRLIHPDVPDKLESIIFELLAIRPENRPHNAFLAAKKIESLLRSLEIDPEHLFVRPMDDNTPKAPSLGPTRLPGYSKPPSKKEAPIGPTRGMVIENGIIDLGGIVTSETEEETELRTPDEGRPSEASLLNLDHDTPAPARNASDVTVEPEDPMMNSEGPRTVKTRQSSVVSGAQGTTLFSNERPIGKEPPKAGEGAGEKDDPGEVTPLSVKMKDNLNAFHDVPASSRQVRHGEVLIDHDSRCRPVKDEPIPNIKYFDEICPKNDETASMTDPDSSFPAHRIPIPSLPADRFQDSPTRDGLEQPPSVPTSPAPDPSSRLTAPLDSGSEDAGQRKIKVSVPESPKTDIYQSADVTSKRPLPVSRFVAVKEEDLDDLGKVERENRPIISLQIILTSICLILVGLVVFYMLQPVPPETLFERIVKTIEGDGSSDSDEPGEIPYSRLRRAGDDIRYFIRHYGDHPKADRIRYYEDQLELADLERHLERRRKTLVPAERAYLEAISYERYDPEQTIIKLRAMIDLFSSDAVTLAESENLADNGESDSEEASRESETKKRGMRHRLTNPTEQCIEIARRRLQRLEKELVASNADVLIALNRRLADAERLEHRYPQRAESIRRSIVQLYDDRLWAEDVVRRAKEALNRPRP